MDDSGPTAEELRGFDHALDPARVEQLRNEQRGEMDYLALHQSMLHEANNPQLAAAIRRGMSVCRENLVRINNELRPLPSPFQHRQARDVCEAVAHKLHELYTLGPDDLTEDGQPGLPRPLDAAQFRQDVETTLAHMRQHSNTQMRQLLERLDFSQGREAPVDREGHPLGTAHFRAAGLAFDSSSQGGEGCEVEPASFEVVFGPIIAEDGDGGGTPPPALHGTTWVTSAHPPSEFVFVIAYKDPSTAQEIETKIMRNTPESARRMMSRRLVVSVVHEETRDRRPSTIAQIDDDELRGQMAQLHIRRQQFIRQAEGLDSSYAATQYICAFAPSPSFCPWRTWQSPLPFSLCVAMRVPLALPHVLRPHSSDR